MNAGEGYRLDCRIINEVLGWKKNEDNNYWITHEDERSHIVPSFHNDEKEAIKLAKYISIENDIDIIIKIRYSGKFACYYSIKYTDPEISDSLPLAICNLILRKYGS